MNSSVPDLKRLNLYLVGMMGVGKSTTAQLIAPRFRYRTCDLDTELEALAGATIPDIFARQGEPGFRDWETQTLETVAERSRYVVATGGGVILRDRNRQLLKQGAVVWLDVTQDVLWERLQADQSRPLLQTASPYDTIGQLLQDRAPLYAEVADVQLTIAGNWCPSQVAKAVLTGIAESHALQQKLRNIE